jgi:hypothetical protein
VADKELEMMGWLGEVLPRIRETKRFAKKLVYPPLNSKKKCKRRGGGGKGESGKRSKRKIEFEGGSSVTLGWVQHLR